jgi:hypothetical protein
MLTKLIGESASTPVWSHRPKQDHIRTLVKKYIRTLVKNHIRTLVKIHIRTLGKNHIRTLVKNHISTTEPTRAARVDSRK